FEDRRARRLDGEPVNEEAHLVVAHEPGHRRADIALDLEAISCVAGQSGNQLEAGCHERAVGQQRRAFHFDDVALADRPVGKGCERRGAVVDYERVDPEPPRDDVEVGYGPRYLELPSSELLRGDARGLDHAARGAEARDSDDVADAESGERVPVNL